MRALSLVALLLLSGLAKGQIKLGEPRDLAPNLLVPASINSAEIAATVVGDGYLATWIGRTVRLNAAGEVIERLAVGPSHGAENLLTASNGTDALVGWTLPAGPASTYRLVVLEGGSRHTLTHRGVGSLDALLFDGRNYLAIVGGLANQAEIVQLDRRGFVTASESIGIGPATSDPRTWRNGFFVDGGVAWLVTVVNDRVSRLALTDATGKLQRPQLDRPDFFLPFRHRLLTAGHINGRWYFVHGQPDTGIHYVRFLGSAAPIVIEGFTELVPRATRVSHGELFLFGFVHEEERSLLRGVRVSPSRRVRHFDVSSGTHAWALGTVAIPRGVLLVSANVPSAATSNFAPPVARLIRTIGFGERTFVRPPTVLNWAPASQSDVTVAAHGAGFLTAWHQLSVEGIEVWTRLVDRDGNPVGEPRPAGHGTTTKIASSGDVALLIWLRDGVIEARRVNAEGVPAGEAITLDRATKNAVILGAGWDGAQFSVAWMDDANVSTIAVSSRGEVLFPEPVRMAKPSIVYWERPAFAVSPFGALLVYGEGDAMNNSVMAVALGRDLRPLGAPFKVIDIPTYERRVVWAGDHYIVTATQNTMLRGARVTPSGRSIDAPWGIWLNQRGTSRHRIAYANDRLLLVQDAGSVIVTDRNFRNRVAFNLSSPLPYDMGMLAMRDDGATVFAYAVFRNTESSAVVRTID